MSRFVIGLVLLSACGETETPERLQVVDFEGGTYRLNDVPAGTLRTLSPLVGDSARLFVEAEIRFPERFPRDRGLDRSSFAVGGVDAQPSTRIAGSTAVALDIDSLGLLTGFSHLDRAVAAFEEIGVAFAEEVPVYYAPEFVDASNLGLPSSDNAAYLPELDAFALLPNQVLPGIPLAMNPGVAIHELSHRLFYYRAYGARLFETLERVNGQLGVGTTFNRLRAVDEGVADFFAASFMNDPRFLEPSVVGTPLVESRDLTLDRVFPASWLEGIEPRNGDSYDPYGVGVLFASTLWAIAGDYGHGPTQQALLDALTAIRPRIVDDFRFEFGDLMREVLEALPGDRALACAHILERYQAAYSRVSAACP